ncbi:MAG: hypothetical protein IJG62_05970 [Synergistaceae bacterium]|nr:hypothetical protein [Synergistaceae bacterium]MBQ3626233.1 hypothetical protein [Synergistaceae bacterium]MBQ4419291.1 hypothetical protein [Synergistaceae bacterium]MBQ7569773.1 hypothetical protein [Synergistaceae bacterium]MBQ9581278.1 hypothetical protein [Synergistaceae bacterium]
MNKKFKLALILLVIIFCSALSASAKPRLAIREFADKTKQGGAPVRAITDMMTTELDRTGIFNLVERENLNYIADELKLSQSGLMDSNYAPEVGKIKGAEFTMTGAVTVYYFHEKKSGYSSVLGGKAQTKTAYVELDIRIINTATSEIIYSAVQRGEASRSSKSKGSSSKRTYGGILESATRDAVIQHAKAIEHAYYYDE